jgi:Predicted membrane protein
VTRGEPRWAVTAAILVAVALQLKLPERLTLLPSWALPVLELVLLIGLVAANPRRVEPRNQRLRWLGLTLICVISLANGWAAAQLVTRLVHGTEGSDATSLLLTGGNIWLTNVIVFALWYWEWDRGGPADRMMGHHQYADFLFVQMQSPESAAPDWEPAFLDYLYLSFTNSTAFSPTDVMPLSRWAKMLMMLQSTVSLVTVVLVVARAVNILQ